MSWGQSGIHVVAVWREVKGKKLTFAIIDPRAAWFVLEHSHVYSWQRLSSLFTEKHSKHGLQKEWGTFILRFYGNLKEEEIVSEQNTKPQSDTINYTHMLLSTFTMVHGAAFNASQLPVKGLRSGHHILTYALFWVWGMNGSWRRSRE